MAKQNENNEQRDSFLREVFSENGYGSSKRVFGAVGIVCVLFSLVWLVVHEGGTSVVEDLAQTIVVASVGLLGLTSFASIFTSKNNNNNKNSNNDD